MIDRFVERRSEQRHQRRAERAGQLPRRRLAGRDRQARLPAGRSASRRCGSRRSSRTSRRTPGFDSYHGYWTQDFLRPNAHFGDLDEAARARRQGAREGHARDPRCGHEPHGAAVLLRHQRQRSARRHGLRRRLLAHVPADLRSRTRSSARADELTYCDAGQGLPRAHHRVGSRLRPARRPGLDVARLLRPRRRPVHRLARQEPHAAAAPARLVRLARRQGVVRRPELVQPPRPRLRVVARGRLHERTSSASRRPTGDFPGGLKDLNTDNPDVKEALIALVRVLDRGRRLRRLPHRHRQAHRSARGRRATCAASGATSPTACARRRRRSASRTSSSSAKAFDGNDDLIGSYTWGGTRRGRQVRPVRLGVLLLAEVPRHRCRVRRRASRRRTSSASTTRASAATRPTRGACTNGYSAGPDYQRHAARGVGRRRHRARAAAGARQLPRQPRPAALHVREDRSGVLRVALMYLYDVGRHPVRLLRHRAGLRRRRRSEEPRGHVPRQPGARLRAVRDRPRRRSSSCRA